LSSKKLSHSWTTIWSSKKGCLGRNISIEDAVKKSKKPTVLPIPLCMNYPIQKHRIIVYGIIYVCLFLCHILYEHRTDSALYLFNENSYYEIECHEGCKKDGVNLESYQELYLLKFDVNLHMSKNNNNHHKLDFQWNKEVTTTYVK